MQKGKITSQSLLWALCLDSCKASLSSSYSLLLPSKALHWLVSSTWRLAIGVPWC